MIKMNGFAKLGVVIGGYVAAGIFAYGAVYINDLFMDPTVLQSSGGMSAFGDLILFIGVFGLLALIPTGLGVYFLVRKFVLSK